MSTTRNVHRRWFQFRLRTLLALTALIAVGLFAWRLYVEPFRRQRQALAVIEELGGTYQAATGTAWQRRLFGQDFQNLTSVNLADVEDPAAYLGHVADLPAIATLVVGGQQFGDEYLPRLRRLSTLRTLVLDTTSVSDEAAAALQETLPELGIFRSERRAIEWLQRQGHDAFARRQIDPRLQNLIDAGVVMEAESVDFSFPAPKQLTDADLDHVARLRHLDSLSLFLTDISDAGLARLESLTSLKSLSLTDTPVSDVGLSHLRSWVQLEHLDLMGARVTDAGMAHLKGFAKLQSLDLTRTSVGDAGLAELATLTQLVSMDLSRTQVTDAGLGHLHQLKKLKSLDLAGTRVTAAGFASLRQALPNCAITTELPTKPCHPGCFPAGTAVRVPRGTMPIERLREGDLVITVGADGKPAPRKVVNIFVTRNRLLKVRTDAGVLETTATQPVCLEEGGFRPAGELKPNDSIWRWDGAGRKATAVREVTAGREAEVFNLVLGDPTVFVVGDFLVRSKPPAVAALP